MSGKHVYLYKCIYTKWSLAYTDRISVARVRKYLYLIFTSDCSTLRSKAHPVVFQLQVDRRAIPTTAKGHRMDGRDEHQVPGVEDG